MRTIASTHKKACIKMSGAKTIRRNCLKEHNKRRIHIIGRLISWFIIFDTRFKCYVGHLTDAWFHDIFPIQLNALCEFMPLMYSMHIICDAFYELATSHLLWLLWILAFILWFIPSILRAIWHQRWPGLHWIGCIDWKSVNVSTESLGGENSWRNHPISFKFH